MNSIIQETTILLVVAQPFVLRCGSRLDLLHDMAIRQYTIIYYSIL